MRACQAREGLPGAHLEQDAIGVLQQRAESVAKTYSAAQVVGPVRGIGRLTSRDPAAVQVGDPRDNRLVARNRAQAVSKRLEDRIHHGRMEGV